MLLNLFAFNGELLDEWGPKGGASPLRNPWGIAVHPQTGNVFVADSTADQIFEFTRDGQLVASIGSVGSARGQLDTPRGLEFGPGGLLYVADYGNRRVQAFDTDARHAVLEVGDGIAGRPEDLTFDSDGALYVVSRHGSRMVTKHARVEGAAPQPSPKPSLDLRLAAWLAF